MMPLPLAHDPDLSFCKKYLVVNQRWDHSVSVALCFSPLTIYRATSHRLLHPLTCMATTSKYCILGLSLHKTLSPPPLPWPCPTANPFLRSVQPVALFIVQLTCKPALEKN